MPRDRDFSSLLRQKMEEALRHDPEESLGPDPLAPDKVRYMEGSVSPPEMATRVLEVLGAGKPQDYTQRAWEGILSQLIFSMKTYARDRATSTATTSDVGPVGSLRVELGSLTSNEISDLEDVEDRPKVALRLICEVCEAQIREIGDGHVTIIYSAPPAIHVTHHKFCYCSLAREKLQERAENGNSRILSEKEILSYRAARYHGIKDTPWGLNIALKEFLSRTDFLESQWHRTR